MLAANERSIVGGLLERHGVREAVRRDLDALLSRPDYLTTGSNEVLDDDGILLGHMFVGEDGRPFFEPAGGADAD